MLLGICLSDYVFAKWVRAQKADVTHTLKPKETPGESIPY